MNSRLSLPPLLPELIIIGLSKLCPVVHGGMAPVMVASYALSWVMTLAILGRQCAAVRVVLTDG